MALLPDSLRGELRDFRELVLIPGLAALLPWSLGFRLLRRLAQCSWLFRSQTELALAGAQTLSTVADPQSWARDFRLLQLVDQADLYLSLTRSDRWLDRHMTVQGGPWPTGETPFLAITFHWGTGLWCFRHLRRHGVEAACLFRYFDAATLPGQRVRMRYYGWRVREVERGGNTPAVFTGRSNIGALIRTLEQGKSVVALLDVPPDPGTPSLDTRLLGRRAWLPRGLVRFAVSRKIPVVAFTIGVDRATGQRLLSIQGPLPNANEQALLDALSGLLEQALGADPAAWHFWGHAHGFFSPQETGGSAPAEAVTQV